MTTGKKTTVRFLLTAAVLMLMLTLLSPLTAFADEQKEYTVESADFRITLSTNGDAEITETWNVTFTKGSFSRFTKDIYNPDNELEKIKDLRVQSCRIDGAEAQRQEDTERRDGHYSVEKSRDRYTISWYQSAMNQTVEYQITYVIPGAVKMTETGRAAYCYRLIGVNFPKTVGTVTANIVLPQEDSTADIQIPGGSINRGGNTIVCQTKNHSGMYKLRIKMDASPFDDLKRITGEVDEESGSGRNTVLETIFIGIVLVVFFLLKMTPLLIVLGVLALIFAPRLKAKKKLKRIRIAC